MLVWYVLESISANGVLFWKMQLSHRVAMLPSPPAMSLAQDDVGPGSARQYFALVAQVKSMTCPITSSGAPFTTNPEANSLVGLLVHWSIGPLEPNLICYLSVQTGMSHSKLQSLHWQL
ncbi:hypothetical protein JRQ81_003795 [Phrynocephalus forsythii]|uniref:Uncharacterized protein n=1 Tax=Phrynocephalus forsythii TaxID=171643 RepID=A0A9Q0XMR4_9SAUR|nr:hypothetical protein JRQ81_003795 [Phrynocephalus forsythii]